MLKNEIERRHVRAWLAAHTKVRRGVAWATLAPTVSASTLRTRAARGTCNSAAATPRVVSR
jgi:hypothetical protein